METPLEDLRFRARILTKDISELTGEPKELALVRALEERLQRLTTTTSAAERANRILAVLESSLWQNTAASKLGATTSREREDEILGYDPEGV